MLIWYFPRESRVRPDSSNNRDKQSRKEAKDGWFAGRPNDQVWAGRRQRYRAWYAYSSFPFSLLCWVFPASWDSLEYLKTRHFEAPSENVLCNHLSCVCRLVIKVSEIMYIFSDYSDADQETSENYRSLPWTEYNKDKWALMLDANCRPMWVYGTRENVLQTLDETTLFYIECDDARSLSRAHVVLFWLNFSANCNFPTQNERKHRESTNLEIYSSKFV